MPTLKSQIDADLKESMLAKDQIRVDALRMLKSAIRYIEIEKKAEADDNMVIDAVAREIKKRRDAAEQFRNGGKEEMATKEEREIESLSKYLPEQLGENEIKKLIDKAVKKVGASGPSDMGKVMGALMSNVKGRADGSLVSKLVKEALTK